MSDPIRIRATELSPKNCAYLFRRRGQDSWHCTLENGTPVGFSSAGITAETPCRFALEDCTSAEEALIVCERFGSHRYSYELI